MYIGPDDLEIRGRRNMSFRFFIIRREIDGSAVKDSTVWKIIKLYHAQAAWPR